ncbi:TetR/AcrR family transcriptional regulator [Sporosarcina sp. BI001-red]|uniref:TetR/AcrR family transcriptional regulator n=1 Tax=Sporosarcina sp. BI001-red TaxID=2282866 RepID=UPI000E22B746|nr:TetR/AcrR family transcriptional regulator [Sporosarcina sp. BI001-red]REB05995.1 TetR/AcrR family transcriptional regulator [Sporosarcina sp. BI001-red]
MNERKLKIILAAQQVFQDKGIVATSVQDILTAAGISKGTFYNYFTSKNECLLAILEIANEESITRRRKLLLGQDRSDKTIFALQIVTRAHVDRERNLLPIYEAVFFSNDDEMRTFVRKQYLSEISWLSGRLLEVYGPESEPYNADGAVMLVGMMQHIHHFVKIGGREKNSFNYDQLVPFAIRRLDDIMTSMISSEDKLLGKALLDKLTYDDNENTKELLMKELRVMLARFEKDKEAKGVEYATFLLEEIVTGNSGPTILESVTTSFQEHYFSTPYADEVSKLCFQIKTMKDLREKGTCSTNK